MFEIFVSTTLGLIAGIMTGLLPGLGTTTFLLLSLPLLIDQSLLFCVIFYCVLSATSQYFGSITTLCFGIPGESTSLPLLTIRSELEKENKISDALFISALGSLIASIFSLCLIINLVPLFSQWFFYLKSYVSLILGLLGCILCVLYSNNKIIVSFLFLVLGWILGKVGYNPVTNQEFLTFDSHYLYSGLPVLPIIIGIYAIPNLLKSTFQILQFSHNFYNFNIKINKKYLLLDNIMSIIRGSIIGFFSGLIPFIGSGISSLLAYTIEKKINNKDYIKQVASAESANNSANLSVLVPLLSLGVAIVTSEYVLLEILYNNSMSISWKFIEQHGYLIFVCVVFSNIIAFIISLNFINFINKLVLYLKHTLPLFFIFAIFSSMYYFGLENHQEYWYLIVCAISAIFGLLFQKFDILPFIFAFLLQNTIDSIIYRVTQIYF
jgi:putative tricarboxylic transport membrane protein